MGMSNDFIRRGWRELGDLPNQEGFRFVGVMADGTEVACVVSRDEAGLHRACREGTGEWMFPRLNGWRKA